MTRGGKRGRVKLKTGAEHAAKITKSSYADRAKDKFITKTSTDLGEMATEALSKFFKTKKIEFVIQSIKKGVNS